MTFFNPFNSFNCFFGGINNWFTPMFSCWNSPPMLNFSFFFMNSWNFYTPPQPNPRAEDNSSVFENMTFTYDKSNYTDIWSGQLPCYSSLALYDTFVPSVSSPKKEKPDEIKKVEKKEKTPKPKGKKKASIAYNKNLSGGIDNTYLSLSRAEALKRAKNDPNLEELTKGKGWEISNSTFKTDIPFAKKGTGKILDEVSRLVGTDLLITSALGTGQKGNPHSKKSTYASHHNAENPKLDIRIPDGYSSTSFAQKLRDTGYFSHVLNEGTHIDVQIDPEKYKLV